MAEERDEEVGEAAWRRFLLPMALCFGLGLTFAIAVMLFTVAEPSPPELARLDIARPAGGASFASPDAALARLGGVMAYRGYAAIAAGIAAAVIVTAVAAIRLFVADRSSRRILYWVMAGQVFLGVLANMLHGSGMSAAVRALRCAPTASPPPPPWDVCSIEKVAAFPLPVHYGFNAIVDALSTAATAAVIFATFIVASSAPPRTLPAIVGSAERGVTILLVAASALLVSVTILDKSFLHWAFADYLALDPAPKDVVAYVSGMSILNGGLETALLAGTWFVSLLLMGRSGQHPSDPDRMWRGFSTFNLSAIFAPVLSAVAANLLAGQ